MKNFLVLPFFLALCACAQVDDSYQKIDAADFVNYGVSPLKNTLYEGSDDEYHYFSWSNGKNRGRWKLLKSQMRLACEIQYGTTGGMPLVLSNSGDYVPYSCREAR
ncbi:MAG: hypothetical protein CMI02_02000 [Oceanospirillaceae bacterium]|nr:hypothetical protein [Oceanospirillaceae bacterium]MBT10793.1 hypothetical protein [Oceanospirillaceae bacterium]|tara:strand:- start:13199 stop:13516 length:318 start_codon:yes stop_codon:yes gene_type:complete